MPKLYGRGLGNTFDKTVPNAIHTKKQSNYCMSNFLIVFQNYAF